MNINDITRGPLKSVSELIDLGESLQQQTNGSHHNRWAYRGQPREFKTLVPSFQRQFSRQSFGTAEVIETRLIDAFREHYALLKDRSSDMPGPELIGPGRDLRCLSVMQHYEIPTRLLDWTTSFWTSVYFACASDPSHNAELWHYDRRMFERQRAHEPLLDALLDTRNHLVQEPTVLLDRDQNRIVELDPQITPRMKQQMAHHTVSTNVFADHAPLLYELQASTFSEVGNPKWFGRYIIDSTCKPKALQYLAEHKQITASTVFPDVVGLGRFLRWQFESLRTMLL